MSDTLRPHGLYSTRLLCPGDSPGKNTGVGCHALLHGISPTLGSNSCISCIAGRLFIYWVIWEVPLSFLLFQHLSISQVWIDFKSTHCLTSFFQLICCHSLTPTLKNTEFGPWELSFLLNQVQARYTVQRNMRPSQSTLPVNIFSLASLSVQW